jgi:hypothetical protein
VLLNWSKAVTVKLNAVPAVAVEGALTTKCVAPEAVLVSENVAGVATPLTLALTEYAPLVLLAVAVTWVWPLAFVTAGELRLALAPLAGAVKVTVAPGTGLLEASNTVTTKGAAKAVPTAVLCGVPLATTMLAGGPK